MPSVRNLDLFLVYGGFCSLFSKRNSIWESLFSCSINRLADTAKRFSGRIPEDESAWLTGDATLQSIGCINWKTCEYMRLLPRDVLTQFAKVNQTQYINAECELGAIAAEIAQWASGSEKNTSSRH